MIALLPLLARGSTPLPPVVLAEIDFGVSDAGWTSAGQTAQWEWGVPTSGPGGPTALWATNLAGNYLNDTRDTLTSGPLDLAGAAAPSLVLEHWYAITLPDAGWVEVDGGAGFVRVEPLSGYPDADGFAGISGAFVEHVFDLTGFGPAPRVQLVFEADATIADDGWYVRSATLLDGDGSPPQVAPTLSPVDTQDLLGPYPVTAAIVEEGTLVEALLHWEVGGIESTAPLTALPGDLYTASIPAMGPGTTVRWWITACDGSWETRSPEVDAYSFRVYLAAPTGLVASSERPIGLLLDLEWEEPVSPETPFAYEVWRDGAPLLLASGSPAQAAVDAEEHTFQVRAQYPSGFGDFSEPITVFPEIPSLAVVEPASAWPGDTVRVRVEGQSLYLVPHTGDVDFGPGVRVESVAIDHADAADIVLSVAEGAEPGPRRVQLGTAWGAVRFDDAFVVEEIDTAPRIVSVTPAAVPQRGSAELVVVATAPFAGPVVVNAGPELVVTSPAVVDGDTVTVGIAVDGDARPGAHTLVLDDGLRLWTATVEVTERVIVPPKGCASAPGALLLAWIPACAFARRARPKGRETR